MMFIPTEEIELTIEISTIAISPETVAIPLRLPEKPELTTITVVGTIEAVFLEDLEKGKQLHPLNKTIGKLNVADQLSLLVHRHLKEEANKLLLHKEAQNAQREWNVLNRSHKGQNG